MAILVVVHDARRIEVLPPEMLVSCCLLTLRPASRLEIQAVEITPQMPSISSRIWPRLLTKVALPQSVRPRPDNGLRQTIAMPKVTEQDRETTVLLLHITANTLLAARSPHLGHETLSRRLYGAKAIMDKLVVLDPQLILIAALEGL